MPKDQLFSQEPEIAVLSMILKYPYLLSSINGLRYFMFSSSPHQALFAEFEDFFERGLSPDPSLIISSLESKGIIDKVGSRKYIEQLVSKEYNESSFQEFINLVISSYKARSFISVTAGTDRSKLTSNNVDDYIRTTKKALEDLIDVSGHGEITSISDLTKEVYEEIVSRTELGNGIRGHSWGFEEFDKAASGKCAGDLWVIAGRPGQGKTSAVLNSVVEDGKNGVPVLLIEREMRKQELVERLISIDTGIPNTNIRLGAVKGDLDRIKESLKRIKEYPIYLETNYRVSDPYYMESVINKYKNKHGIEVVYLDYIQLLAERDESQTQEIGRMARMFKLLANELDICSVILSQFNRNVEMRDNKRPLLSDLKQSGALEEDADFVVGLYRDEYYNPETKYKNLMEYIVLKNRNGPPGTITARFDGPTYRIFQA